MTDKPQQTGLDGKNWAERDRIDLNDEIAGRETGRIKRFFPNSFSVSGETQEQKEERRFQSMLEILLSQDPYYAALYEKVSDKLDQAQRAVDQALIDIDRRLKEAETTLQLLRNSAATLDDGTLIFQSEQDGHLYTEDGRRLSDDEADSFVLPDEAPSWEQYQAAQDAHATATHQRQEIETYQREVIDPINERMQDEDDPPSMEELEEIDQRIESELPSFVKADFLDDEPSRVSSKQALDTTDLEIPDLAGDFDLVRTDIPAPHTPAIEPEPQSEPTSQVGLKPVTLG